jgi:hypothetical protein
MFQIPCVNTNSSKEQREQLLRSIKQPFYAVVDGCQAFDLICKTKQQFALEARMLFEGPATTHEEIGEVAPYVCAVNSDRYFLEEWVEILGHNVGILITSDVSSKVMYKHLRKIFISQDETNQEYFFRFYDPRVIRGFLPSCRPDEINQFFGPIRSIIVEDIEPGMLMAYWRSEGFLVTRRLPVKFFCEILEYFKASEANIK